jgi:hypothetical protein
LLPLWSWTGSESGSERKRPPHSKAIPRDRPERCLAQGADVLVVNGFVRVADSKGSMNLSADQTRLLRDLIAMKKPLAYTAFGSPYVLTHVPELPVYAVTYDTDPTAELAAVKALTGEIPFQGRLPINLLGLYPLGHRLTR